MPRPISFFVAFAFTALIVSCTNPEEKKLASEGETAFKEFRNFVVTTEEDAESDEQVGIDDTLASTEEIGTLKNRYRRHNIRVGEFADQYPPHQREELIDLRERFNIAIERKQKKTEDASRRYQLRSKLFGIDISSDDLSEITATNIRKVYSNFLQTLSQDLNSISDRDWEQVEGFWSALNTRKTQLEDELKPTDINAISKKQEEYEALKTARAQPPQNRI